VDGKVRRLNASSLLLVTACILLFLSALVGRGSIDRLLCIPSFEMFVSESLIVREAA
jgi:hypothetical protein